MIQHMRKTQGNDKTLTGLEIVIRLVVQFS